MNITPKQIGKTAAVGNSPVGGPFAVIGVIEQYRAVTINQTTAGQTIALPSPGDLTVLFSLDVFNIGTASFTFYGQVVASSSGIRVGWNGTAYIPEGSASSGTGGYTRVAQPLLNVVAPSTVNGPAPVPSWSASYTTLGGQLRIDVEVQVYFPANAAGSVSLLRDGSVIETRTWGANTPAAVYQDLSFSVLDTPTAGAHTYSLSLGSNTSTAVTSGGATLTITELVANGSGPLVTTNYYSSRNSASLGTFIQTIVASASAATATAVPVAQRVNLAGTVVSSALTGGANSVVITAAGLYEISFNTTFQVAGLSWGYGQIVQNGNVVGVGDEIAGLNGYTAAPSVQTFISCAVGDVIDFRVGSNVGQSLQLTSQAITINQMTGFLPASSVVQTGSVTAASNVTSTTTTPATALTVTSIVLPSAGTYKLEYTLRSNAASSTNNGLSGALFLNGSAVVAAATGGTLVAGSELMALFTSGVAGINAQGSATGNVFITVAAATTVALGMWAAGAVGSVAISDANGRCSITFTQIGSTLGISSMVGATAGAAGTSGLTPTPAAGTQEQFLRGDGAWAFPAALRLTTTTVVTPIASTAGNVMLAQLTAVPIGTYMVFFNANYGNTSAVATELVAELGLNGAAVGDPSNTIASAFIAAGFGASFPVNLCGFMEVTLASIGTIDIHHRSYSTGNQTAQNVRLSAVRIA